MNDFRIIDVKYNEDDNTVYVNAIKETTLSSITINTILENKSMDTAENFIKNELKRKSTSVKIDNDSNIGHGHTLSVKIVMPCYCQANCPFCFNKQTSETQVHNFGVFYDNLNLSLDLLFNNISNRKISLDITGNEPTFNTEQFREVMDLLRSYKARFGSLIDKVVLTTNGYHLFECIDMLDGVVDVVNISVHHYDYEVRRSDIFKTKYIPSNNDLKSINNALASHGIKTTSIAVINSQIGFADWVYFLVRFSDFSNETGFENTRIRLDFTDETGAMEKMFDYQIKDEVIQKQSGLFTKIVNRNGYEIRIYKGVKDLVDYVIGVEMVIDDDGNLYLDYNKKYPLKDRKYWLDFNNYIYIFDKK